MDYRNVAGEILSVLERLQIVSIIAVHFPSLHDLKISSIMFLNALAQLYPRRKPDSVVGRIFQFKHKSNNRIRNNIFLQEILTVSFQKLSIKKSSDLDDISAVLLKNSPPYLVPILIRL